MGWNGVAVSTDEKMMFLNLRIGCEESGKMMDLIVQYLMKFQHCYLFDNITMWFLSRFSIVIHHPPPISIEELMPRTGEFCFYIILRYGFWAQPSRILHRNQENSTTKHTLSYFYRQIELDSCFKPIEEFWKVFYLLVPQFKFQFPFIRIIKEVQLRCWVWGS